MNSKLRLGYWGIRGQGQVTRLVCAYTGIQWEQKTYTDSNQQFDQDKKQLQIIFPSLPYIVDYDIRISESEVLPRYVIKKSGQTDLLGKDPKDMALVDNIIYGLLGLWQPLTQLFFNKKLETEKTAFLYKLKPKLSKLQKFIGLKDKSLGYLTLADFFISEFSYYVEKLFFQEYKSFKSLQNIRNTIENLEGVKNYYAQQNSIKEVFLPINKTVIPFYLEQFQPKLPPISKTSSAIKKSSISSKKSQQLTQCKQKLKILLITGSLQKKSEITGLLRACVEINNPGISFSWANITNVPLFNREIQDQGTPDSVQKIKNQVLNSHGILFAVPQYNSAPSAALKNVYDWLSRGMQKSVIREIPAGMISVGYDKGGEKAQKAFRIIGEDCQVKFMEHPVIAIKKSEGGYFDDQGNLIDENIKNKLKNYISSFALWVNKHKKQ